MKNLVNLFLALKVIMVSIRTQVMPVHQGAKAVAVVAEDVGGGGGCNGGSGGCHNSIVELPTADE